MRALLVLNKKAERDAIGQWLGGRRHHSDQASDYASALGLLDKQTFDSVLLDWSLPGQAASAILNRLREMELPLLPHVVVALDKESVGEVDSVFAEGASDFLRKPFWKDEVIARLEAPSRLRSRCGAARFRDWSAESDPFQYPGWRDMGSVVARDLAAMVGCEFESTKDPTGFPTIDFAAKLAFVSAARAMEIHVLVGVSASGIASLAEAIVGVPTPPAKVIEDLLREIANTAAGALKRAAPEEEPLTTGLPECVSVRELRAAMDRPSARFTCRAKGQAVELAFVVERASSTKTIVSAANLREGMVLVEDLRNEAGLLLIAGGTRLTSTAADRVARILGTKVQVEVAAAA